MAEQLSPMRRQSAFRSPLPGSLTQKLEDMEGKEIMGPGRDVQNRDQRIAFSVNGRPEKGEGSIAKGDVVQTEQETSNDTGGAEAQRIMDKLNDSARMATKIVELQQKKSHHLKLKQQVSTGNIDKHLVEQRALEVQLENRNAEIGRLRVDLSVARTNSQEKDAEIKQLRDSLERLRQEVGKKSAGLSSNARDASLENPPVMTDVPGDFNLAADREKRGNGYLLSSLYSLISLIVDEPPTAADGMSDSLSSHISTDRKARLPLDGNIYGLVSKSSGQFIFASTTALFIAFLFFLVIS